MVAHPRRHCDKRQALLRSSMTRDHFVARTYLKAFGDPDKGGMLHA